MWQFSSACKAMAQDRPNQFVAALAAKVQLLEKENAAAVAGVDGWLFLTADLRFLSVGRFWGDSAAAVSRAPRPDCADPLPAILDFNNQLKQRGIHLLVVPVPAKAAIYPEKLVSGITPAGGGSSRPLASFYEKRER
jgi:SGNH hydrolase-like domain, acetyltransferase AlgX